MSSHLQHYHTTVFSLYHKNANSAWPLAKARVVVLSSSERNKRDDMRWTLEGQRHYSPCGKLFCCSSLRKERRRTENKDDPKARRYHLNAEPNKTRIPWHFVWHLAVDASLSHKLWGTIPYLGACSVSCLSVKCFRPSSPKRRRWTLMMMMMMVDYC